MNARVPLQVQPPPAVGPAVASAPTGTLPVVGAGVQRMVWAGRFGEIVIEVVDGQVRVNGDPVEPADLRD